MAKGNPLLGQLRGSIGDVTFSRSKGQQVSRARNRKPLNPRSISQMRQRALFANPVKFFARGTQALFKFAFEDKKANESDYNAFMRHNIAGSIRISKQASKAGLYPAIGTWQLTNGSLMSPAGSFVGTESKPNAWRFECPSMTSDMQTIGALSSCLKKDFGLMEGDIITYVHIIAHQARANNMPAIVPPKELTGAWWFNGQFKLDSSSADTLESRGFAANNGYFVCDRSETATDADAQGFAIVISRPQPNGLLVSTSNLINNAVAETIITTARTSEFEEEVIDSWKPSPKAVLEGALIP